ncbi:MAG: holo-ACP synthase [Selenomonadaceae bacterium]|nr:holo-ACP synthase [Selenomonadaceae bacterium]
MILGLGTDIIEVERIKKAVCSKRFKDNVFTEIEQAYCQSRGKNSAASYAARFAAKEAFFKALGTGIVTHLTEVEVINDEKDAPKIFLHGKALTLAQDKGAGDIFLTLSHSRDFATAVCILTARQS